MASKPEHLGLADAQRRLASAGGARYVTLFHHNQMELEFYAPQGTDPQEPHTRDELYFIASGTGTFVVQDQRRRCAAGDVMYLPAGVPHRFEAFSADFAAWAVFVPPGPAVSGAG